MGVRTGCRRLVGDVGGTDVLALAGREGHAVDRSYGLVSCRVTRAGEQLENTIVTCEDSRPLIRETHGMSLHIAASMLGKLRIEDRFPSLEL